MTLDLRRLIGLIDQTIPPRDGLEAHFVRVGKGDALPASPTEVEWWEAVVAYRNGTNSAQQISSDSDQVSEIRRLKEQFNLVTAEKEKLSNQLSTLQLQTKSLHEAANRDSLTIENLSAKLTQAETDLKNAHQTLTRLNSELTSTKNLLVAQSADLEAKTNRLSLLESDFSRAVEDGVKQEVGNVLEANTEYRNINNKLSSHVAALISQLTRFIPPRVKCPKCEGVGTWYDQATYRTGADWEGHPARDVCQACRGAGWITNPERDALN